MRRERKTKSHHIEKEITNNIKYIYRKNTIYPVQFNDEIYCQKIVHESGIYSILDKLWKLSKECQRYYYKM